MDSLQIVQSHKTQDGLTLKEKLESKFANYNYKWVQVGDMKVQFIVEYPMLKNPLLYHWKVDENNKIHALNGKAIQLSPELDRFKEEQIKRKNKIPQLELEIYNFIQEKFRELERKDGGYLPEKHDEIVLNEVKEKYGLTFEEVDKLLVSVEKRIYNI